MLARIKQVTMLDPPSLAVNYYKVSSLSTIITTLFKNTLSLTIPNDWLHRQHH